MQDLIWSYKNEKKKIKLKLNYQSSLYMCAKKKVFENL